MQEDELKEYLETIIIMPLHHYIITSLHRLLGEIYEYVHLERWVNKMD